MNKELLYEIIMPNFPRTVRLSESRRAKYFKPQDKLALHYLEKQKLSDVVGHIPEIFSTRTNIAFDNKGYAHFLKPEYDWKQHKKANKKFERRLYDCTLKDYIIKNPSVAGTPNDEIINGQSFYNGGYHPNVAGKIMETIHNYMIPFLEGLTPLVDSSYPLIIDGFMYDKGRSCEISGKTGRTWDMSNRSYPYNKAFEDVLQKCGIIKQDDFEHIIGPPRLIFVNLDNESLPKQHWREAHVRTLVYQIYKVNC